MITAAEVRAASHAFCAAVDALAGPENWTDDHRYPRTMREAADEVGAALEDVRVYHDREIRGNQIIITVLEFGGRDL